MKRLYLDEFYPDSELVVAEHQIKQAKFPAFDIHTHMGKLLLGDDYQDLYDTGEHLKNLQALNVQGVVNLDGLWGTDLVAMLKKNQDYPNEIKNFMWIDFTDFEAEDFTGRVQQQIRDCYCLGAKGIKLWKFISLGLKDKQGNYLRLDDSRLNVIFTTAADLQIPVLMHVADPTAFFKPIDQNNERWEELQENPDWSFADQKFFRFAELMTMQDNVIARNPKTTFIVAHFGSYSENLGHVATRLEKYPNMYIDTAARLAELGRQPYTSREFFLRHQDRILFGTDFTPIDDYRAYYPYFRFFETKDEYFDYQGVGQRPGQGRWKIYGIDLPDEVLRKIYYDNARQILKL